MISQSIIKFRRFLFSIITNILRHLKLEIALAFAALNDENVANNSAGQRILQKAAKHAKPKGSIRLLHK